MEITQGCSPRRPSAIAVACIVATAVLGVACREPERPVSVTGIQVGRSRNADKTIGTPALKFGPGETIYAAVLTSGRADHAIVRARWTYGGGVVGDSEETITHRERGVSGFELRNATRFPTGRYTLEVFLNGTLAGTRDVMVEE